MLLTNSIIPCSISLAKVQLPGVAANVLLAAGAVALDSFLISRSSQSTLGGRVGDLTYSKVPVLSEPTAKGYDAFVRTTKPIPSSIPSSMTAGVMFGLAACFLSLVTAGAFLIRTHAGSQSGATSSSPPLGSSPETLVYNREQHQSRDGRAVPRRSGRRREFLSSYLCLRYLADKIHYGVFVAPNPIPPNNNNNIPTEDVKPPVPSKLLLTKHFHLSL